MTSTENLDPRLQSPKKPPSQPLGTLNEDAESEWEYEYSATETETFYVTLDLSKADFRAQEQLKSHKFTPRGPWPVHKASEAFLNRRNDAAEASQNSAASSAASSDGERDDEDDEDQPRMSRDSQNKRKQSPGAPDEDDGGDYARERVQILDLHSDNPLISYKGRVFSGSWCENTTTELLLTPRDDTSPLPVLRHLDDEVDLLAASASRINVSEKKLKPKYSEMERHRASTYVPQTIIPPVDLKASQERIAQRNFLADLIALKRRKGETDDVTIIARSMQGKRASGQSKGIRTHRRGRWAHSDRLSHIRGIDDRSRRAGRRKGNGRGRGNWALLPLEEGRDSASVASSAVEWPLDGESAVSTPTPLHWEDLIEGRDEFPSGLGELMEVDMDDEDEAESDENNDYEEDEDEEQVEMDEDED